MKTCLFAGIALLLCLGCAATPQTAVPSPAQRVLEDVQAIASVVKDNITGEQIEISRMQVIPSLPEKMIQFCQDNAKEYAERKKLVDWKGYCCPVTSDGKVHCETRLN